MQLLLPFLALAVGAPQEDEAHRLDRMETQRLNNAAISRLSPIVATASAPKREVTTTTPTPAEQKLRAREERAIEAWRARVALCGHAGSEAC